MLKEYYCRLKEIGIDGMDLKGILITHEHSDHIGAGSVQKSTCLFMPMKAPGRLWSPRLQSGPL